MAVCANAATVCCTRAKQLIHCKNFHHVICGICLAVGQKKSVSMNCQRLLLSGNFFEIRKNGER